MYVDSYGIHIGLVYIHFYGIIVMTGALVGTYIASRMIRRMDDKVSPDIMWDALVWALVLGVIGARLYHVFTPSKSLLATGIDTHYYLTHPLDLIASWQGGLGIPGAIIGGVIGMWIFAHRNGFSLWLLLDATAPGLAIGQAIGRWGNFVNQEIYGPPTNLPWGIPIRPEESDARVSAVRSFSAPVLVRIHPERPECRLSVLDLAALRGSPEAGGPVPGVPGDLPADPIRARIPQVGLRAAVWDQFQPGIDAGGGLGQCAACST